MMRRFTKRLALLLFLSTSFSTCISTDTLTQNQPLVDGQTLVSTNGSFALGFFTPSPGSTNRYVGVWFNNISVQTVVWVANRQNPINDSTGSLAISSNGRLIITIQNSTIIWSAAMTNLRNPIAQLLDDGNFVVREEDSSGTVDSFAWQSFDYPTSTLLPGMKLGWNLTTGLNRNLTSWSSDTDPSPGPYSLTFNLHGDPQLFLMDGTTQFWRVGPWNGLRLVGLPEMDGEVPFTFSFVDDPDEVYYTYHKLDPSVTVRLIVNNTGLVQRQVWIEQNKRWNIYWQGPDSECDQISSCGPFGMCNENNSPLCSCLPGFDPKSPVNWALRDGRDGCVRKTALDCRNRTDGFETVSGAKLPDTTNATVNMNMSLDACKAKCLSNCLCTAYASADVQGGGSGCVIWTTELTDISIYQTAGQDLYVRLAAADLESLSGHSHSRAAVAIVLSIIAGITIVACIGCCIWRRKKKKRTNASFGNIPLSDHYTNDGAEGNDLEMPLFNFDTVAAATNNFSIDNKLGQGGFGPVYKGVVGDGQEIAVKRLAKTSIQGSDEFKNEVMLIAKLQHRNLVRLLGYCIHREEKMLIYEYMPNKSLDVFLFDKARRALLDWQTRIHIILGIARGLVYLHQDSRLRIIHRDLKASNILLDGEMNPKISDFGMARIFGGDETEVNTRKVVGTFGYMAPEYAMDGIFSVKSDVFSFGVLVLEIISGKKNRGVYLSDPNVNLLGFAWSLWKEGNGLQLVDEAVGFSYPMSEALRCIKVGLLCVQERHEHRPSMSSVVLMLGSDNASLPTPKEPGFVSIRGHTEGDSSTSKQDTLSANDMTVTVFEGR